MREDWVAYVVVFSVVGLMLLGKKMMFFDNSEKKDTQDINNEKETKDAQS